MREILTTLLLLCAISSNAQLKWTGTWATAPQMTTKDNMPPISLSGGSIRQVVHISVGGSTLRIQLSNEYGDEPLLVKSIFIANAIDSCDIDRKSARYITFSGKKEARVEAGKAIFSDAVKFELRPLQLLAVTINYETCPKSVTSHPGSRTTSYIIKGEAKPNTSFASATRTDHWYHLSAIDVYGVYGGSVAVLGNSITDGRGSTTNHQNRWTDICAEKLIPQQADLGTTGILNLGIGGNCVLKGGIGEPAIKRFERDILGQRNLSAIILFEGVNDIGNSKGDSETVAMKLIETIQEFARKARAKGVKVFAATITPFKGHYYYTPFHEAARQTFNGWVRTSDIFDGIVDFDMLMRDSERPETLKAEWQEDWLHPNATGYRVMGEYAAEILLGYSDR